MKKIASKARTFGTIYMVGLFALLVVLISWLGYAQVLSLGAVVALLLTAIIGSPVVALATKKKEGMFAYINIFLTVMLVSILIGGLVGYFTGFI